MKRTALFLIAGLLVLTSGNVFSQDKKVIDRIIEIGTTDNQSMDHLDVLTNRIGGRLIGSDAYDNAVEWAAYKFREWGMDVVIDEVGELSVGFNRGPWFGRMLGENGMTLHFATPSYTAGTKGVQRGHVVMEPKSQDEFDNMKGKLKGAWVLIGGNNSGWPVDYSPYGDDERERIMVYNDSVSRLNRENRRFNWLNPDSTQRELIELEESPGLFYRQMVEAGILGIIQSSSVPIRALYDRKNLNNGYMTWETLPTVPDIKLDEHQFEIIEQMVKERRYFLLEFDIRNHFQMGPVKYHNVLGIIKGTKYPGEYVIMGGHLDAFDVATGGVDDGSGVTPHMEAARLIMEAGGKPKRTIICALWAGEEFGLLGSKSWVERNEDKWPEIANYFNRDGGPTVANSLSVPEAMYDDFEKICEPLNSINPDFPFTLRKSEPRRRPTRAGGSDHAYFAINGVPTISFGTADPKGYDFNYGEIWHTERDLYNKSIPEYQEHTAVVTAVVVYGVAMLDHLLKRDGMFVED
jgi:hypothetical protein